MRSAEDAARSTLEKLEQAINENTQAVLVTYLFGVVPDVERLMQLCRKHGLLVVEDFSHSLNAKFKDKKLGTFGDVGIYSCSITKTLDAYGGGLAVTDDAHIAAALRSATATLAPSSNGRLRAKIRASLIWNLALGRLVFTVAVFPLLRFLGKVRPTMQQKLAGAQQGLKAETELPDYYFEQFTWFQARVGLAMLKKVDEEDAERTANVAGLKQTLARYGDPYAQGLQGGQERLLAIRGVPA